MVVTWFCLAEIASEVWNVCKLAAPITSFVDPRTRVARSNKFQMDIDLVRKFKACVPSQS